jgi:soluble lytic murein transglycosylase-like protein
LNFWRSLLWSGSVLSAGLCQAQIYSSSVASSHQSLVLSNLPSEQTPDLVVAAPAVQQDAPRMALPSPPLLSTVSQLIQDIAAAHALPAELVRALIRVESGNNPRALSPKGARGLMQLMPATAARFGVKDAFDPAQNIEGGVRYLKYLLALFDNRLDLALAAYNAGEYAVVRAGYRIPNYPETLAYVPRVVRLFELDRARTP